MLLNGNKENKTINSDRHGGMQMTEKQTDRKTKEERKRERRQIKKNRGI